MKSKYTLGLNILHADSSACLFKDNKIVFAIEEERVTRIKHDSKFPFESIKLCLKEAQIGISDIDVITINNNPRSSIFFKIIFSIKNVYNFSLLISKIRNFLKKKTVLKHLKRISNNKFFNGKIVHVDHHKSHIYSNFFYNRFKDSVHVSVDGFGDFASTSYGIYEGAEVKIKKKILFPHSLGIFYQAMTQYLGFRNYGDEYKVMGMAAYGKTNYDSLIEKIVNYKNFFNFNLDLDYFTHHKTNIFNEDDYGKISFNNLYSTQLISLLGESRGPNQEIAQYHKDIAKSVQNIYETTLYQLLEDLFQKYKIKNLSLSGGCAMNSLANGKIVKNTGFENIYISPNPGDAGASVGSCLSFLSNKYSNFNNFSPYLGSQYDNNYIEEILKQKNFNKKYKIQFIRDEGLFEFTAELLNQSNIVSWFQNRAEWGPRALGNRSILADPRIKNISEFLNKKIKKREDFRPFAPSVLEDEMHNWFEADSEIPYMSEVKIFKNKKKNLVPAVVHIDGTGRVQTVSKKNNYRYFKLLDSFFKITNVPILLNTSFNENEPIVNSPEHAIDCFERTNIDVLVLQNWVVQRL